MTDEYWIEADRKVGEYPKPTRNSGKWLIFVPLRQLDAVWAKIRTATEDGHLGGRSKSGTKRPNPNAKDPNARVVCVYTYDWTDKEDVMRIRANLRKLGITWKIPYKADEDTFQFRYSVHGDSRISKYFE